jgi:hypothetical protein
LILGATALAQATMGGTGGAAMLPYLDLPAGAITLTSSVTAALSIAAAGGAAVGTRTYPPVINQQSNLFLAANNKKTALAASLAIDGMSLTLTDASTWPASGAVTLDESLVLARTNTSSEIVYFSGRSGNVLTLTERARGGTAAKVWASGQSAEMRMTAEHHNILADAIIAVETQIETNTLTGLTGDVTTSGTGEATATIANGAVTFAKIQDISTNRLIGRSTSGTGSAEQISIGSGLSLAGGQLSAFATGGSVIDVTASPYNALGDVVEFLDGVSTASSTTFTSATANFTDADVGKRIWIEKVGPASGFGNAEYGGAPLRAIIVTTITGRTNATTITVGTAPQVSLTGLRFLYGSDDTAALQSAFNDLDPFGGQVLLFPAGRIFFTSAALTIQRYNGDMDWRYGGTRSAVILVSGYGATIMCHTSNAFIQIAPSTQESCFHTPVIEGLHFEGVGGTAQTAIELHWTFGLVIRDIRIIRVGIGMDLRGALHGYVKNCIVDYFMTYGMVLASSPLSGGLVTNVTIVDTVRCGPASTALASFYLEETDMCELLNCVSESSWATSMVADVNFITLTLASYARRFKVENFYSEIHPLSGAVIKVISNGTTIIEGLHRHVNPMAPLVDVTGSSGSSVVVRDLKVIKPDGAAVNEWILFKQNAANTVGWLFENAGEFATGESRDLTANTAFWVGGTLPNKVTQIEPGRVVNRSV